MSRLIAWWEEFWKSFTWIGVVVEGHEKVMKIAGILVAILLLSFGVVVTVSEIGSALKPLSPYLIGSATVYVTWKAAIAWDRSKGPIIWIDDLSFHFVEDQIDENVAFEIRVRNIGYGEVDAFIYIVDFRDSVGKRIVKVGAESPVTWSGINRDTPLWPVKLFGEKFGFAKVFRIFHPKTAHGFRLFTNNGGSFTLDHLQEISLNIRVDFHEPIEQDGKVEIRKEAFGEIVIPAGVNKGKFVKSKSVVFSIIPDTRLPELCQLKRK